MNTTKPIKTQFIIKWIVLAGLIIIIDLFFKYRIKDNYEYAQGFGILNNFIQIKNINLSRMTWGWQMNNSFNPSVIIPLVFQFLFLLLFIRVQTINIHKLFRIGTLFIFMGIVGNYLDRFLLSNGQAGYVQMDYIYIEAFSSAFFNLSSLLCYAGAIILIIAILNNFKDIKKIFSRRKLNIGVCE